MARSHKYLGKKKITLKIHKQKHMRKTKSKHMRKTKSKRGGGFFEWMNTTATDAKAQFAAATAAAKEEFAAATAAAQAQFAAAKEKFAAA